MLEQSPDIEVINILKATKIRRNDMIEMDALLVQSAVRHRHLCPRQVLGVRIGLAGAKEFGLDVPRRDKRLFVFVETDGCFISGVEVATGCCVNRRTMRVLDYGKIAAVFVDVTTGEAMRVAPRKDVRHHARDYAPHGETRRYFAMLHGYQTMPDDLLLTLQRVELQVPLSEIFSRPGVRVNCDQCGEEIINEREVKQDGKTFCMGCIENQEHLYSFIY